MQEHQGEDPDQRRHDAGAGLVNPEHGHARRVEHVRQGRPHVAHAPHLVRIHCRRRGDRLGILLQAVQAADRLRQQQAQLPLRSLRPLPLLLRLLLAQVAPEALDHDRRARLPDLDQHLSLVAVLGAHAGREVHAQQRQRHLVLRGLRGAVHGGLPRADGERLHRQAGDPADQQADDTVVPQQVLEHQVADRLGDLHATLNLRTAWRGRGRPATGGADAAGSRPR